MFCHPSAATFSLASLVSEGWAVRTWQGRYPRNSTGGSYGDMSGAQPLNVRLLPADRMETEADDEGAPKL